MAKFRFGVGIGFSQDRREIVELPDKDLEGLTDEQRKAYIEACHQDWMHNHLDAWWEPVEDDEDEEDDV